MTSVESRDGRSPLPSFASRLFKGHAGAATMAGILEIAFFHPFDTTAKRLMSHSSRIRGANLIETRQNLNRAIFKSHAEDSVWRRLVYLYPGSTYAVVYKVLQRVYKFAGQPLVRDYLQQQHQPTLTRLFGQRDRLATEAFAGCLIGLGEVVLLPLDRLKVLSQTNEAAMRFGVGALLRREGWRGMYAGTVVTMTRNAPGSFCLFGGTAVTKEVLFGLTDYKKATFFQNMCAATVGACLSITVTNPMDVIKTRVQNKDPGVKGSGTSALTSLLKNEGPSALFKGLTPKIVASAPKLIFAYTMTELFLQLMQGETRGKK